MVSDVIQKYQNMLSNKAQNTLVNIEDLIQDQSVSEASTYHLFSNPASLNKFRRNKLDTSLFVNKFGNHGVWMPTKFKSTKKSQVANTIDEVNR